MSEEQLTALLAKLKEVVALQEKLKGAADLDAALTIAKEAGFDVSKADWLRYQAIALELSDEELESAAGVGQYSAQFTNPYCCYTVLFRTGGCGCNHENTLDDCMPVPL